MTGRSAVVEQYSKSQMIHDAPPAARSSSSSAGVSRFREAAKSQAKKTNMTKAREVLTKKKSDLNSKRCIKFDKNK